MSVEARLKEVTATVEENEVSAKANEVRHTVEGGDRKGGVRVDEM